MLANSLFALPRSACSVPTPGASLTFDNANSMPNAKQLRSAMVISGFDMANIFVNRLCVGCKADGRGTKVKLPTYERREKGEGRGGDVSTEITI